MSTQGDARFPVERGDPSSVPSVDREAFMLWQVIEVGPLDPSSHLAPCPDDGEQVQARVNVLGLRWSPTQQAAPREARA